MTACPAVTCTSPDLCSTRSVPRKTTVYSSNSGVWPGSSHPSGLCMWATLMPTVALLIRPTYSSMTFGLFPADSMRVGCGIRVGMMIRHRNNPQARCTSERRGPSQQVIRWSDGRLDRPLAARRPGGDARLSTNNLGAARRYGRHPVYTRILRGSKAPGGRTLYYENHPMKIVSTVEMREIDRATSERFGVSSITLMENAGSAVARFVLSEYPQAERVGILCGKGNNGGDGFVAARKLVEAGRGVRVLLLCDPQELRGDAAAMFQKLVQTLRPLKNAPLIIRDAVRDASGLDSSDAAEIFAADVIVVAILGPGFRRPVRPPYAAPCRKMKRAPAPIVAVDIPSGTDADAMRPHTSACNESRADAIVTFTAPRPAHVFAGLTSGPTVIAPIGSPPEAIASQLGLHLGTPSDFAPLLAPRARDANKGSYGHVLIIGGSFGKAGAAAMAGVAALPAGAGLFKVATPKTVRATVAFLHPHIMLARAG